MKYCKPPIAQGGYGKIHKAIDLDQEKYVIIKELLNDLNSEKFIENEYELAKKLRHPNIVKTYDYRYEKA